MNHGTDAVKLEDVEHALETNVLQEGLQNSTGFELR